MRGSRVLAIAAQFAAVVLGVGVLVWVWTSSEPLEPPPTTKAWLKQLEARDGDERKEAVQELGGAGPEDLAAVLPALIGALNDNDASVRNEAVLALGRYVAGAVKGGGRHSPHGLAMR